MPDPFFGNAAFGNLSHVPTMTRGQLLRPFPQFADVLAHHVTEARAPLRRADAASGSARAPRLGVNANYTFSRLMDKPFGESNTYSARNANALDAYAIDASGAIRWFRIDTTRRARGRRGTPAKV